MEATTFAAIAGQVLSAEFIPYASPVATAPLLAVPNEPLWINGQYTIEYVMYSTATHSVTVQTSAGEFGSDVDDSDQLSRVLSTACKRMESALAALIAA